MMQSFYQFDKGSVGGGSGASMGATPSLSLCLHSLHSSSRRLRMQMLPPPQSWHRLRLRLCTQMFPPPHSLHELRRRKELKEGICVHKRRRSS
jgi:hypothetical protein